MGLLAGWKRGWAGGLGSDGPPAWEESLARLGERAGRVRALLAALAFARGSGLPRRGLWADVATGLLPGATGTPVTGMDVRWLLHRAGGLVVAGEMPGGVVCRLADEALAAYLREQPGAAFGSGAGTGAGWARACEQRVTDALLCSVAATGEGRDWGAAPPYLRAHLVEHAAASGDRAALRSLLTDLGFLAVADPAAVRPLMDVTDAALRKVAQVYSHAWPLLGPDPAANMACLAEVAHAFGWTGDEAGISGSPRPLYRPVLVSARADDTVLALTGHTGIVNHVACWREADDSLLLASAGDDRTVRLWDPRTGRQLGEPLTGSSGWLSGLGFGRTASGRLLVAAVGEDRVLWLWDARSGESAGALDTGHVGPVFDLAFGTVDGERSAGGGRLIVATCGSDGTIRLWDPEAGVSLGEPLTGHTDTAVRVVFFRDGDGRLVLASAGGDCTVRLWDPLTGRPLGGPLTGHTDGLTALAIWSGPDGRLLLGSGGYDRTIRVWDLLTGTPIWDPLPGTPLRTTRAVHGATIPELEFGVSAQGTPLMAAIARRECLIWLWDPLTGAPAGDPLAGPAAMSSLLFISGRDGEPLLVSAGDDGAIRMWDPAQSRAARRETKQSRWVDAVAVGVRPMGRPVVVSVGGGNDVRVWDTHSGAPTGEPLAGHTGQVDAVAVAAIRQGQLLAATGGTDRMVRLWDLHTGTAWGKPLSGHTAQIRSLAFGTVTGNGQSGERCLLLASAGDDQSIRVWDPSDGSAVAGPLTGHTAGVDAVAFGTVTRHEEPGVGALALASAGDDGTVRLWRPLEGVPLGQPLRGHDGAVRTVVFAPAGSAPVLASAGDDQTIRLWDPGAGVPLGKPLTGHTSWIRSITFATMPDGHPLLISGGGDRTIRIWDPLTQRCLLTLRRLTPVRRLAATGLTLAVGDDNGLSVIELEPTMLATRVLEAGMGWVRDRIR
ncbi:MAG TPA: WD40 repeat domain-containing protein [Streptosporangiaceae bacterium]|nr:WD40 repeat domain-containing protein [Streptosporangiaceae bacterium]